MSQPNSRKRPAPGSTPIIPVSANGQQYNTSPQDQVLRWAANGMPDASAINPNPFMLGQSQYLTAQQQVQAQQQGQQQALQSQQAQQPQSTSTAIARRPPNRALIPSVPRPTFDTSTDPWNIFPDDSNTLTVTGGANGNGTGLPGENESIEVLEERAQRIKKEAQAKRKQIPPFVQKLSSFLEEQKNTELIRWSENGDSFIVLDEEEFAKTLIPELFKHNNYASFVRQLNMYGFHKRVGLSDNSMKASERKNKSPSEYYNPYFKRGHPNLLWLINKPKSGSKSKKGKKEDGEADSDDDGIGGGGGGGGGLDDNLGSHGLGAQGSQPGKTVGAGSGAVAGGGQHNSNSEVVPLQKKDLQLIKDELSTMQTRQAQISKVMQRLQYDNAQLQQQARLFQNMHERHENSINAILNFLANVFRKSLEEQGGVQGVTELLASILPNGQMPTGSVVDVSDDFEQSRPSVSTTISTPKRQQRLLPPIPAVGGPVGSAATSSGRVSSISSSSASHPSPANTTRGGAGAPSPANYQHSAFQAEQPMGSVTEVFDSPNDLTSPSNFLQQELQANPQEGMMKIIQDTNANTPTTTSGIDLPEVAATTPINLSSDQRNRVLSLMSGHNGQHGQVPDLSAVTGAGGGGVGTHGATSGAPIPPANLAGSVPMMGPGGVSMSPNVPLTIPGATGATTATAGGAASNTNLANLALLSSAVGNGGAGSGGIGGSTGIPPTTAAAGGAPAPHTAPSSLSPILAQMGHVPPPPSLRDISNTQSEIEALQRLQDEQNSKISDLTSMLGPLSPSGRIPGIDDDGLLGGSNGSGAAAQNSPGYFDLGQYLDPNAFGDDFNFATSDLAGAAAAPGTAGGVPNASAVNANNHSTDGEDFNFGLDTDAGAGASVGTGATTVNTASPSTTDDIEEIPRSDLGGAIDSPDQSSKRRRVA